MVLTVGQQVGSYQIVQEIAHGQYSYIYKASHIILKNRIVALKLLYTSRIKSEQESEQFFQEARILDQLQHPHILPIIDTNVYEHFPYIVTEFAVHGSLRDRLRKLKGQPVELTEALEIAKQIGEGLQFAHEHKIVHSDIKPENILFNTSDSVRISDFDIARILQRTNVQTVSGGGTPSYMAPEQFQGKVRKESDQYALGCIVYEMLTGKRAFKGDDMASLAEAHLHSDPQPPRELNRAISPGLEQAIQRALARKYSERYESVADFIQALTSAPMGQNQKVGQGQGGQLILKNERQGVAGEEEIYYEKTVVEEAGDEDDPFGAVTVVDENAPVKRRPARRTTASVAKKTTIAPAKTGRAKEGKKQEEELAEVKVKKVGSVQAKGAPAKKAEEKVKRVEEEKAAPVHKTAAILAREAIMPKHGQADEKVEKVVGEKKVVRGVEEERAVTARKRSRAKE